MNFIEPRLLGRVCEPNTVYLLHDNVGSIIQNLTAEDSFPDRFSMEIIELGNLGKHFDLTNLSETPINGRTVCPGKKVHFYKLFYSNVYMRNVVHNLVSVRIDDRHFLGRVRVRYIFPNIISSQVRGFFFSNLYNDVLEGFQHGFYSTFLASIAPAEELLGMPLSQLFSPTPLEFQKNQSAFDVNLAEREYSSLFHYQTGMPLPTLVQLSTNLQLSMTEKGLELRNSSDENGYLRFQLVFAFPEDDLCCEIEAADATGEPLFFTLTNEGVEEGNRYLLGYMYGEESALMIKRFGVQAALKKVEEKKNKGRFVLHKRGRSLHYIAPDGESVYYYDSEFLSEPLQRVSIGLRRKSSVLLNNIQIKTRKGWAVGSEREPVQHLVRVKTVPDTHFILSPFFNSSLTNDSSKLSGFLPLDVSQLQRQVKRLSTNYEVERKKTAELTTLLKTLNSKEELFIGESDVIRSMKEKAVTLSKTGTTVLIEGPTGSGKEVLARFIHSESARHDKPFVKVDCTTIPRELFESHLFGHEKGAFTGAVSKSIGLLETASGGTLFLDEVGNIPIDIQKKLLQFFNDFTVIPVGGKHPVKLNVRCIAASNENLVAKVEEGSFRSDLFYRLNTVTLRLPALRYRVTDIPLLVRHYLHHYADISGKEAPVLSSDAMDKLTEYAWPGNIRELKNVVERSVLFCKEKMITAEDLLFNETAGMNPVKKRRVRGKLLRTSKVILEELLVKHEGNVRSAAIELGVGRVTLYLHLKRLEILPSDFMIGFD